MASAALADEVVLRNGSSFSGVVREQGDKVIVEMDYGSMTFKKVDVKSIVRGEDVLTQYQEKSRTATDVKSMMELAAWAKDKGLAGRAAELHRKVLVLDPDQAEARKALGYEKVNGLWLSGDELMTARGFVKLGGRWMGRETAEKILEQEAAAKIETDRLSLERRVADQKHVEEMTRLGLERDRLEHEKSRDDRWMWRNGWTFGPAPFGGVVGYILPMNAGPSQTVPPTPPTTLPLGSPSPVPPSRPR
ncbi:MAG: hypothetical protein HY293_02595 [Planctomycetes bacterium]|nr:hypothetical protein [Planctomycetota bacterium]